MTIIFICLRQKYQQWPENHLGVSPRRSDYSTGVRVSCGTLGFFFLCLFVFHLYLLVGGNYFTIL